MANNHPQGNITNRQIYDAVIENSASHEKLIVEMKQMQDDINEIKQSLALECQQNTKSREMVDAHEKLLHGNGREGLVTIVSKVQQELEGIRTLKNVAIVAIIGIFLDIAANIIIKFGGN